MGFGQALGLALVITLLSAGFVYWIIFFIKKINPDLKYDLKYKIFKKKYNEKEVKRLLYYYQNELTIDKVYKILLVKRKLNSKKARELCYIYKQIQSKGGNEHGK